MTPPEQQQKRLLAAGWGLALGCGGGILLAAFYLPLFGFLLGHIVQLAGVVPLWVNGVISGGVVGMGAGLAAGAAKVKTKQHIFRLAMTRGLSALIAAVPCVIALAIIWMILLGLFNENSNEYFPSGWGTAFTVAVGWVICVGPLLAVLGFVVGGAVALLIRDR